MPDPPTSPSCECPSVADLGVVDMGAHEDVFASLEERARPGAPRWWLSLEVCRVCGQGWLVGADERHNDVFCMRRLSLNEVAGIEREQRWPSDFDSYEALLRLGRDAGRSVRFVDPLGSSSLSASVEELVAARPLISVAELASLLAVELDLARVLCLRLPPVDPRASRLPRELRTKRLLLRRWRAEDREPFFALNADARVMEHFPAQLSRQESDRVADLIERSLERNGFGLWAVELPGQAPFIGFAGLSVPRFEAHFTPCVEIGWRLAAEHWGRGYATEAARAALAFAFDQLGLDEVVSFTVPENARSRRVMEKLGMLRDPLDDFERPDLPDGFRRHVLYRIGVPR